jgi:hypothetical protein
VSWHRAARVSCITWAAASDFVWAAEIDWRYRQCSNCFVHVRRASAWISTAMVAIAVALAVPVAQLRTVSIVAWCCCPDPSNCHCPDHEPDSSTQPSVRACHNTQQVMVAPEAPAFAAPAVAAAPAPAVAAAVIDPALAAPHPAPPLPRPDAPS